MGGLAERMKEGGILQEVPNVVALRADRGLGWSLGNQFGQSLEMLVSCGCCLPGVTPMFTAAPEFPPEPVLLGVTADFGNKSKGMNE